MNGDISCIGALAAGLRIIGSRFKNYWKRKCNLSQAQTQPRPPARPHARSGTFIMIIWKNRITTDSTSDITIPALARPPSPMRSNSEKMILATLVMRMSKSLIEGSTCPVAFVRCTAGPWPNEGGESTE